MLVSGMLGMQRDQTCLPDMVYKSCINLNLASLINKDLRHL